MLALLSRTASPTQRKHNRTYRTPRALLRERSQDSKVRPTSPPDTHNFFSGEGGEFPFLGERRAKREGSIQMPEAYLIQTGQKDRTDLREAQRTDAPVNTS